LWCRYATQWPALIANMYVTPPHYSLVAILVALLIHGSHTIVPPSQHIVTIS
jgi:hypothetical protein